MCVWVGVVGGAGRTRGVCLSKLERLEEERLIHFISNLFKKKKKKSFGEDPIASTHRAKKPVLLAGFIIPIDIFQ